MWQNNFYFVYITHAVPVCWDISLCTTLWLYEWIMNKSQLYMANSSSERKEEKSNVRRHMACKHTHTECFKSKQEKMHARIAFNGNWIQLFNLCRVTTQIINTRKLCCCSLLLLTGSSRSSQTDEITKNKSQKKRSVLQATSKREMKSRRKKDVRALCAVLKENQVKRTNNNCKISTVTFALFHVGVIKFNSISHCLHSSKAALRENTQPTRVTGTK